MSYDCQSAAVGHSEYGLHEITFSSIQVMSCRHCVTIPPRLLTSVRLINHKTYEENVLVIKICTSFFFAIFFLNMSCRVKYLVNYEECRLLGCGAV
jgi:hypothetical protein